MVRGRMDCDDGACAGSDRDKSTRWQCWWCVVNGLGGAVAIRTSMQQVMM